MKNASAEEEQERPNEETVSEALLTKQGAPLVEVVIEISRGSFIKRGFTSHIDFVSPIPCPFNYGSIPAYIGLEGDLLDAVVLGPRLKRGTRVEVKAWGAIGMTDRGMYDDKLICSDYPLSTGQRRLVLGFFHFYAWAKGIINFARGQHGENKCEGWVAPAAAIQRATPRRPDWRGSAIRF